MLWAFKRKSDMSNAKDIDMASTGLRINYLRNPRDLPWDSPINVNRASHKQLFQEPAELTLKQPNRYQQGYA